MKVAPASPSYSGIERSLPSEDVCRGLFQCSAGRAAALWRYEPQQIVWRAVRLSADQEVKSIEAVRAVFPFTDIFPPPSRSFFSLLGSFPLEQLFTVQNKMHLSKFIESQKVLRLAAIHLHNFFNHSPKGTVDQFKEYLEKNGFFSQGSFNEKEKETFISLLNNLFEHLNQGPSLEKLESSFLHRIYTLKNGLTAIHNPQAILDAVTAHAGKKPPENQIEGLLKKIKMLGVYFVLSSLKLHYHQLTKEPNSDSFSQDLHNLCNKFNPFIQRAVLTVQDERIDFQKTCSRLLSKADLTGNNSAAALTCTFLQPLFTFFGYHADILTRRDIDPTLSLSFAHAVILVTDSGTGKKFILDPTYKQFLYGLVSDEGKKELSDLLLFEVEKIDPLIDQLIELKKRHPEKGPYQVRSVSDDELRIHFKRIWGLEGSSLVTVNLNGQAIFSEDPSDDHRGYALAKELVKTVGLDLLLKQPTMKERGSSLKKEAAQLDKLQLLERLRFLNDTSMEFFIHNLHLDPRPIQSKLLTVKAVGYFTEIRELVNPKNDSGKIALYGCAGSDLSPLLALNPGHLYMIERTPVDIQILQSVLHPDFRKQLVELTLPTYKEMKSQFSGQLAGNPDPELDYHDKTEMLEVLIAAELEALGVNLDKVKVRPAPEFKGVTLSFPWKSHGQNEKNYQVTWISAHLEEPETYPRGLKQVLEKGVDYYYQKAANHSPKHYDKFLPGIAKAVRKEGYMLTSDYDMFGKKHSPGTLLKAYSFTAVAETPLITGYKRLFKGLLPLGWIFESKEKKMEDRIIPPSEEYFLFMDIRKKGKE